MAQFLDIFGFLSVLLRGLALAFEALTVGGVIFQLAVARQHTIGKSWLRCAAALLAITQTCIAGANAAMLMGTTDLGFADMLGADFCRATLLVVTGALATTVVAARGAGRIAAALGCISIIAGSTMMSHSMARVDTRPLAIALTLIHHGAGAAWIGGLPYLLIALRRGEDLAATLSARFSRLAVASVTALTAAGAGLGWIYGGSAAAVGGTTYGAMLVSKVLLTAGLLLLGFLNFRIVRAVRHGGRAGLLPMGRFAEAELGIGLTVLLVAASLTSTPPAVDVQAERVTTREIVERMTPRWPRMETPAFAELSPATPLAPPGDSRLPESFVPGQQQHPNTPADIAWSEYNHHWAGLIVLAAGLLGGAVAPVPVRASLAAGVFRAGDLPVDPGRFRELAIGAARFLGELSGGRGGAAPVLRPAGGCFRGFRVGGANSPPGSAARGTGLPPGVRGRRRGADDALALAGECQRGVPGRTQPHTAFAAGSGSGLVAMAGDPAPGQASTGGRVDLAGLSGPDWHGAGSVSGELINSVPQPSTLT